MTASAQSPTENILRLGSGLTCVSAVRHNYRLVEVCPLKIEGYVLCTSPSEAREIFRPSISLIPRASIYRIIPERHPNDARCKFWPELTLINLGKRPHVI